MLTNLRDFAIQIIELLELLIVTGSGIASSNYVTFIIKPTFRELCSVEFPRCSHFATQEMGLYLSHIRFPRIINIYFIYFFLEMSLK